MDGFVRAAVVSRDANATSFDCPPPHQPAPGGLGRHGGRPLQLLRLPLQGGVIRGSVLFLWLEFIEIVSIGNHPEFWIGLDTQLHHVFAESLHIDRDPRLDRRVDEQPQDP